MKDTLSFFKKNIERLKELSLDCPMCIQERVMCHHYDYLKRYIEELEMLPPFNEEKFIAFWKAYPVKKAKAYAEKIWIRMKMDDELFDIIMAALEEHKLSEQWVKDGGRFIPHASTWLNQRRWEDELEVQVASKTGDKYDNI